MQMLAADKSRARSVVESFLQNVVIIDDLPYIPHGDKPTLQNLQTPSYTEVAPEEDGPIDKTRRDVYLNAEAVIRGFADLGSVCAVLKTEADQTSLERAVRAAVRADIVVLDWKIEGIAGESALRVVKSILEDDENSHRLRLIAIYTGEPDLSSIATHIQEVLSEFHVEHELIRDDSFRISRGPTRVIVLAKKGTLAKDNGSDGPYPALSDIEVSESKLADKLTDEFVAMTSGLLRSVALAGITTVRNRVHRVLARFDESLDPAYLGHRLLLPHPPDAEDHVVAALGSEMLAVLEEDRPGVHAGIEAIEEWLLQRDEDNLSEPFAFDEQTDTVTGWRNLLMRGIDASKDRLPTGSKSHPTGKSKIMKQLISSGTEAFTPDSDTAMLANRRFSALLSLRTRYPGQSPRLTIGTILSVGKYGARRFLLCLQPKCDSIRLDSPSGFPLMPLEIVEIDDGSRPFSIVVEVAIGQWTHLSIKPKPSELTVRSFEPGPNPPGEIEAIEGDRGEFHFKDTRGWKYRWIAQLKDEHALRVAGDVAAALARPGPNDAEWLRRASERS